MLTLSAAAHRVDLLQVPLHQLYLGRLLVDDRLRELLELGVLGPFIFL
jgi:hypothetical protein